MQPLWSFDSSLLKLKHALWFAAVCRFLGMEVGLTHIQEFLRLSDNVVMFYPSD